MSFRKESAYIREYLWKYRSLVAFGILALILVDALEIIPPLLIKETVDSLTSTDTKSKLFEIILIYLGISLIQALGRYGWRFFLIRTSMLSGRDLRSRYADHLFKLSSTFFDKRKIGDLMSLATSDIEAIRMAMGIGLIVLLDALVYLLTVPIAMYYLSPKLTFISFIPLIIVPFLVVINERKIHQRFLKVQESFSKLASLSQENLMGIRVIKGFGREEAQIQRFLNAGKEYVKLNLDLARVQSAFGPLLDSMMSIGLVLMLYIGGVQVIDNTFTIGSFIAFQRYIQKMIWPMVAVGLSVTYYQRAVAGSKRLKEVLDEKPDIFNISETLLPEQKIKTHRDKWKTQGKIEIKNLSFSYPNTNKIILKNISLKIEAGSRVAFVGPIGSGKSTLLNLIPRLYPVQDNMIFVDGVDINKWPLEVLRDQIGFVSQDTFLFSETVFENVAFGLYQWSIKQERDNVVFDATNRAAVHPDILKLEKSYSTELGERGVNISGGQRQRLTIARALATEPTIFILDDALSAVDMETETKILQGLKNRTNRNTEIICAHRISTVKEADYIYVFNHGEIVQQGTHEQLLKQRGELYWRFNEQQRLQQEVEEYTRELQ